MSDDSDRPPIDEPPGLEPGGLDPGTDDMFGGQPAIAAEPGASGYRVFARKYRPQSFADLIGQDAMVRTVSNAFSAGRIPQAWMLTGVRGVGKTTTARILARGLNYEPMEGAGGGPTIDMPALGRHCRDIIESRHMDVIEMDAASHTGVDNIRQITDAVRYGPVQARYKVYIIDEVHMLSTPAFNAFLKTLEEPPPHAKFVFATTEIRKVPVTILSRCQRFDLRRVDGGLLVDHMARICAAEGVTAEPEALQILARAAEGSVRDALSLLDQAVAHGAGAVAAEPVRTMLGLADRGQVVDLFEAAMRGDVPSAFRVLRSTWDAGADPAQTLTDLASFCHLVTRFKLAPDAARDPGLTEVERTRGSAFAAVLPVRVLSRAWQILSKAIPEVAGSQRPLAAAEMALVRLAYAADLPTPDEALRRLRDGAATGSPAGRAPGNGAPDGPRGSGAAPSAMSWDTHELPPRPTGTEGVAAVRAMHVAAPSQAMPAPAEPAAAPASAAAIVLRRFEDLVALAAEQRDILTKTALEQDVRPVRFEDGLLEFALNEGGRRSLPNDLAAKLNLWTGRRWSVILSREAGGPTLAEQRSARESERRRDAVEHPLVQAVLASFPGAEIVDVRDRVVASSPGEAADAADSASELPQGPAPPADPDEAGAFDD